MTNVIEQLGAPQEIYERPATVFVADFMGSPSMNFMPTDAALEQGATSLLIGSTQVGLPAVSHAVSARPLLYGVRPEHISLSDSAELRAEVLGVEYLGNCQVVTLATATGVTVRAKVGQSVRATRGDHVGLDCDASQVTLFDASSGRAIRTARDDVPVGVVGTRGAVHG